MMKKILLLFGVSVSLLVFSQDRREKFWDLYVKNDTLQCHKILNDWSKVGAEDPEYYVAAINYYMLKSKLENLHVGPENIGNQDFALKDKEGNTAGYIGVKTTFDGKYLTKGFGYFNEAIAKFPDRLDIRFGKIHTLGLIGKYDEYTDEVINVIRHSKTINNRWLWAQNSPQPDAKNFMLSTIQQYNNDLYNTGDNGNLYFMKLINEEILLHYPEYYQSLCNIALTYIAEGKNKEAISYFLKAEKAAPTDFVILNNIAVLYERMGQIKEAISYYNKVVLYGDEEAKSQAEQALTELKN